MISAMEFVTKSIELAELDLKMQELRKQIDEYILEHGPQSVGPVEYKISTPSRKIDWEATWEKVGYDTGVDIEEYKEETEPVPAVEYYNYRAACKAAKIKDDQLVVTNLDQVENNKTVKVTISHG